MTCVNYFPKRCTSTSPEIVSKNHFLVLQYLSEIDIERTFVSFYEVSKRENRVLPTSHICRTPFVWSTILNEAGLNTISNTLNDNLKFQLTPSSYANIDSIIKGNSHRFIRQIYFGLTTMVDQKSTPFVWGGPSIFTVVNQGLVVSVCPTGIYVSGTNVKPLIVSPRTPAQLTDKLNMALNTQNLTH